MTLIRWEPAREMQSLQSEMNRLFSTFFEPTSGGNGNVLRRWSPAMDLVETDEHYVLKADLPGVAESDVKIELDDNVLTVSGERKASHEQQQAGLLPRRAFLRRVHPDADPAGGRRRRQHQGELRQGRARGADPEARAAQAAQGRDLRRLIGPTSDRDDRDAGRRRVVLGSSYFVF